MYAVGIDLHKVSLGSLIIALGLLVDDAIIAVEMMSVKLEMGNSRFDAACYAFRATAKPMLTGTCLLYTSCRVNWCSVNHKELYPCKRE